MPVSAVLDPTDPLDSFVGVVAVTLGYALDLTANRHGYALHISGCVEAALDQRVVDASYKACRSNRSAGHFDESLRIASGRGCATTLDFGGHSHTYRSRSWVQAHVVIVPNRSSYMLIPSLSKNILDLTADSLQRECNINCG